MIFMVVQTQGLLKILEEVVYSHSRYLDRCKKLIRSTVHGDTSRLSKGFKGLARESRRLEEVLVILSNGDPNLFAIEDLETLLAVVFYVYEVSVEEERDLWSKYAKVVQGENVEEHYARLDRMKVFAQKILEFAEGNNSSNR